MPIKKVISGGQTGADQAGLQAAKALGIATGGHIPKGFMTTAGDMPYLGKMYGLKETSTRDYRPRNKLNVKNSDATLIIAPVKSRGIILTIGNVKRAGKPNKYIVDPYKEGVEFEILDWLDKEDPTILNVAGNAQRGNLLATFEQDVRDLLIKVFGMADHVKVQKQRPQGRKKGKERIITQLKDNEIFVFGSNTEGRHNAGAAKTARKWGARYGQACGRQGQTYAIVTKNLRAKKPLRSIPLETIRDQIVELGDYAEDHPELTFLFTPIGTNRAGYKMHELESIIPDDMPQNVVFTWDRK